MIFRPAKPKMLWDTWLFEWQGTYHMYFLETNEEIWDRIGHAISTDLVHWEARPSIAMKGAPGQWNDAPLLTGMVVRHDERFYMLVCAEFEQIQRVGVHVSDDLCNWTEHDGNPVMIPAGPHYLSEPTPPALPSVDWRDPAIVYREEDEHYHAILCGRRREQTHSDSGAVFGHMRSEDLLSWEHLPPLDAPTAGFYHTEVPDIFELDGRYYLLNSSYTVGGVRHNTTSRDDATGTYYMVSDHFEGPYSLPDDYLLLGQAGDLWRRMSVARFRTKGHGSCIIRLHPNTRPGVLPS